jgi:hypothetical protein
MTTTVRRSSLLGIGTLCLGLLTAAPAMAESAGTGDRYEFTARVYGWFPGVSGDLKYGIPGTGGSADVDAGDILNALEGVFMGTFLVQRGDWSLITDLIYLNLANDKRSNVGFPRSPGPGINTKIDQELTGWVWGLAGGYRFYEHKGTRVNALLGVRMLDLDAKAKLGITGPLQRTLSSRTLRKSVTLWDGIVGVSGRVAFTERWFAPFYVDVGTGDSSLTWQGVAGVGYGFNWGDITLTYRHLSYDQSDDKLIQNLAFSGPAVGVNFRF